MSLLETLHRKKSDTKPQLKIFYWAFCIIFVWEVMPEYIMPILTAVNVFCLAKRNSSEFPPCPKLPSTNTGKWFSPTYSVAGMVMRDWVCSLFALISSILVATLCTSHSQYVLINVSQASLISCYGKKFS